MIQANELRINNWITILKDNGDYFYQIASAHDIEEIEGYLESVEGIPLTTEILIKAGFCKHHEQSKTLVLSLIDQDGDHPTTLQIWPREKGNYIQICRSMIAPCTITNFESVHQLQNLYFSLTGKELEIKL